MADVPIIGTLITNTNDPVAHGPLQPKAFTIASGPNQRPAPSAFPAGTIIEISDQGYKQQFTDGSAWHDIGSGSSLPSFTGALKVLRTNATNDAAEWGPPIPIPPDGAGARTVVYVRTTGNDSTGDGTSPGTAFRTVQHAIAVTMTDVVINNERFVIDCTGITETFPAGYIIPPYRGSSLLFSVNSGQSGIDFAGFILEGDLTLQAIPTSGATYSVTSQSDDAITSMTTVVVSNTLTPGSLIGNWLFGQVTGKSGTYTAWFPIIFNDTHNIKVAGQIKQDLSSTTITMMTPGATIGGDVSTGWFSNTDASIALNGVNLAVNGLPVIQSDQSAFMGCQLNNVQLTGKGVSTQIISCFGVPGRFATGDGQQAAVAISLSNCLFGSSNWTSSKRVYLSAGFCFFGAFTGSLPDSGTGFHTGDLVQFGNCEFNSFQNPLPLIVALPGTDVGVFNCRLANSAFGIVCNGGVVTVSASEIRSNGTGIQAFNRGQVSIDAATTFVSNTHDLKVGFNAYRTITDFRSNNPTKGNEADYNGDFSRVFQSDIAVAALPPPQQPILPTDTTAISSSGQCAYVSSLNAVSRTDNAAISTSRFVGVWEGVTGQVQTGGPVYNAQFTTAGGQPANGAPVYLAAAADDTGTGAGKLTATPPNTPGSVVAEVGICFDNNAYAGSKTCGVLLQPKSPVVLS